MEDLTKLDWEQKWIIQIFINLLRSLLKDVNLEEITEEEAKHLLAMLTLQEKLVDTALREIP